MLSYVSFIQEFITKLLHVPGWFRVCEWGERGLCSVWWFKYSRTTAAVPHCSWGAHKATLGLTTLTAVYPQGKKVCKGKSERN